MNKTFFCILCVLALQSCRMSKMGIWALSDYHRYPIFKKDVVQCNDGDCFHFANGTEKYANSISNITYAPLNSKNGRIEPIKLGEFLDKKTSTTGFLVIKNDSILYEEYFDGYDQNSLLTSYSVAKSFTSALVGIAIEEGFIQSVHDPVAKYLTQYNIQDPNWQLLTVEHLLNMRSGFLYDEKSFTNPNKGIAKLFFSKNVDDVINDIQFKYKPGTHHKYSSLDTQILGSLLETVTGQSLASYLQEKIWIPLGMEGSANWSLDSKAGENTKSYCCLEATARDYAKLGRLYLNLGNWNGKQIVPEEWVKKSIIPNFENNCYQYHWFSNDVRTEFTEGEDGRIFVKKFTDSLEAVKHITNEYQYVSRDLADQEKWIIKKCGPEFYAAGLFEQRVFVNPETDMVFVRLGKKQDIKNEYIFKLIEYALNNIDI